MKSEYTVFWLYLTLVPSISIPDEDHLGSYLKGFYSAENNSNTTKLKHALLGFDTNM